MEHPITVFFFQSVCPCFYTIQQISARSIDNRTNHVSPTSSAGLASPTKASRLARLNSDYLSHTTDTTFFFRTCFKLDINSDQHETPTYGITHTYVSYPSSTLHPPHYSTSVSFSFTTHSLYPTCLSKMSWNSWNPRTWCTSHPVWPN